MLKSKVLIIFCVTILTLAVILHVLEAISPPDSDGMGKDSYGTRYYGMRGIYDTIRKLKLPVKRSLSPPGSFDADKELLVMWEPSSTLVSLEPLYAQRIKQWVENGGTVVLSPKRIKAIASYINLSKQKEISMLNFLLGENIDTVRLQTEQDKEEEKAKERKRKLVLLKEDQFSEKLSKYEMATRIYGNATTYPVITNGSFSDMPLKVQKIFLPRKFQYLQFKNNPPEADGKLQIKADNEIYTLGAQYNLGKGRVIVFSDPALIYNRYLKESDNAVLGVALFYQPGKTTVIEEFYHGLTKRGQFFWLLGKMPYSLIALAVLLAILIWIWQSAIRLGPPLPDQNKNRRSLHEYIEAMSNLLNKADTRRYVLQEIYTGALWHIRRELGLDPKKENAQDLARFLSRKNSERADNLLSASNKIENLIHNNRINKNDAIIAAKEICKCL